MQISKKIDKYLKEASAAAPLAVGKTNDKRLNDILKKLIEQFETIIGNNKDLKKISRTESIACQGEIFITLNGNPVAKRNFYNK